MRSCLCWLNIFGELLRLVALCLRSKSSLAAENLFLRKQLAFYQERKIKPRRTDNPTCVWRNANYARNQQFATHGYEKRVGANG
jgi:hypothetical protein